MAITLSGITRHSIGDQFKVNGLATITTYSSMTMTAASMGLAYIEDLELDDSEGYTFDCDIATGGASATIKAYYTAVVTPSGTIAITAHADSAGTPAGTIAATAATTHTHGLTLAASSGGSSHNHAATPGGTIDNEGAHTHAVALDGGATGAGASHNHVFTGTAITADTFTVAHDATPETAVVYVNTLDGVVGWLSSDCSANSASDYFQTAGGARVTVLDDSAGATVALAQKVQVYYDDDGATADSRLMINNTIMGKDIFVRTSLGTFIRIFHDANAAATGVALYFDDDGGNATLRLNGTLPGTANVTTNATDDTYLAFDRVPTGANAAENTHTHDFGTLADAASGVGAAHAHGITGLTVTNAAEAAHTHTLAGTTVDNEAAHVHASGAFTGSALGTHTHASTAAFTGGATTAAALAEVTAAAAMNVAVNFEAYGK